MYKHKHKHKHKHHRHWHSHNLLAPYSFCSPFTLRMLSIHTKPSRQAKAECLENTSTRERGSIVRSLIASDTRPRPGKIAERRQGDQVERRGRGTSRYNLHARKTLNMNPISRHGRVAAGRTPRIRRCNPEREESFVNSLSSTMTMFIDNCSSDRCKRKDPDQR